MQLLLTILLTISIFNLSPIEIVEESSKTQTETSIEEKSPEKETSDTFCNEHKLSVYDYKLNNHTIFAIYTTKSFEYQDFILRPPISS